MSKVPTPPAQPSRRAPTAVRPFGRGGVLLGLTLVLISVSLRAHIAVLAPLLPAVQSDLAMSAATAGLLTGFPVLCFAVFSAAVPWVVRRAGVNGAIAISLAVIAVAVAIRPWGGTGLLLGATVVMGIAITIGNVLVPVVVARQFPTRIGTVTGFTSAGLSGGAAITALFAVPLAAVLGWRGATAAWAVLTVATLVLWLYAAPPARPEGAPLERARAVGRRDENSPVTSESGEPPSVWRMKSAWILALFFGFQSGLYYATTAWLPTLLQRAPGTVITGSDGGTALSVFQFVGIAGAIGAPLIMQRWGINARLIGVIGLLWFITLGGLLWAPGAWVLWCALAGISQGAGISTALLLISASSRGSGASGISAMVQGIAYAIAAVMPVVLGLLVPLAAGWELSLGMLAAMTIGLVVFGATSVRLITGLGHDAPKGTGLD